MDNHLPILAYHKVDSRRELGITSLSPRRFERQIRFLKREGYISISPPRVLDLRKEQSFATGGASIPAYHVEQNARYTEACDLIGKSGIKTPKSEINKPVLLTFDDGYEGIHEYAYPILKKYSSTAIIFVTTGYIGKYNSWDASPGPRFRHLSWSHIREMADNGIWFGSHGVNHRFLTRLSKSAVRHEIEASKKELEDGLGRSIRFFSYPYGDYDNRIMELVQKAGHEAAFSLRPAFLKSGHIRDSMLSYALPRIGVYVVDSMWAFKAKVHCAPDGSISHIQRAKNRVINRCAYASMIVERLRSQDMRSRMR